MAPRDFTTRLTRRATRAGLFLTDDLVEQMSAFYSLLSRWNQKINLTALHNPDEAIDRLILEPLLAARYVPGGRAAHAGCRFGGRLSGDPDEAGAAAPGADDGRGQSAKICVSCVKPCASSS